MNLTKINNEINLKKQSYHDSVEPGDLIGRTHADAIGVGLEEARKIFEDNYQEELDAGEPETLVNTDEHECGHGNDEDGIHMHVAITTLQTLCAHENPAIAVKTAIEYADEFAKQYKGAKL